MQLITLFFLLCTSISLLAKPFEVLYASQNIKIDGIANDLMWQQTHWRPLDKLILGKAPSKADFQGKFKLLWKEDGLYLLASITDDILYDGHADPLLQYWDDDCLEIFIDEDASGGNHEFSANAFAYHVAIDNQAVDILGKKPDGSGQFQLFNEHVQSQWRRDKQNPHNIIWEMKIQIHSDQYDKANPNASLVLLTSGKVMRFMLAYCDNDGSEMRESFIGSTDITPVNGDKNLGYKTADVFEKIRLVKP